MFNRNLIAPIQKENKNPAKNRHHPNNFQQNDKNMIQNLVGSTNANGEKNNVFYEYEIVDKIKEEKLARMQARRYGLCLCTRWY
jgi:hypothetical protein